MPITGSLGALSYVRAALSPYIQYWAIRNNNTAIPTKLIIDNTNKNIFISSGITTLNVTGFSGFINPTQYFNYNYQPFSTSGFGGNNLTTSITIDNANNIYGAAQTRRNYTSSPFYTTFPGSYIHINATDGSGDYFNWTYPKYVPPSASNRSLTYIDDIIIDNSNNLYILVRNYDLSPSPTYNIALIKIAGANGNADYGINNINDRGIRLALTASGNPVSFLQYPDISGLGLNGVLVYENNKTPGAAPIKSLATIYDTQITLAGFSLNGTDLTLDSNDNRFLTLNINNDGYLVKLSNTQTISWQKKITNTKLYGVTTDSSDNVYVSGITNAGVCWIAKFNNAGTLQWQNQLSSTTNFNSNALCKADNDGGIILSIYQTYQMIIRIPNDGSIPGSGSYTFIDGLTPLTYATSSQTISTSSLTVTTGGRPISGVNYNPAWTTQIGLTNNVLSSVYNRTNFT